MIAKARSAMVFVAILALISIFQNCGQIKNHSTSSGPSTSDNEITNPTETSSILADVTPITLGGPSIICSPNTFELALNQYFQRYIIKCRVTDESQKPSIPPAHLMLRLKSIDTPDVLYPKFFGILDQQEGLVEYQTVGGDETVKWLSNGLSEPGYQVKCLSVRKACIPVESVDNE